MKESPMKLNKSIISLYISFVSFVSNCPIVLGQVTAHPSAPLISQADKSTVLQGGDTASPFTNKPVSPERANEIRPETAPGADAVMTPSLLLISPPNKGNAEVTEPLRAFIGQSLTMKVEDSTINIGNMHGIMISVVNDTSRPLVFNGDAATAKNGDQKYTCASLEVLQKSVLPKHDAKTLTAEVFTKLLPAAISVGLVPTIEDVQLIRKPIRERYGPDERRRLMEASRFGKRILWPHQETKGVIYFADVDDLTGCKIDIAVHTLFDIPDCTIISGKI
jgi:hypothetical protein